MKTTTLFQVRFRPSVTPPKGFTKSAHYNVTDTSHFHDTYKIGNTWIPAKDFIKIEVEDAPVFQKPILRKIASLKCDEVIYCQTDAEVNAIISQAEKEGIYYMTTGIFKAPLYIKDKKAPSYSKQETDTILPASKFVEVGTEPEAITQAQKDECVKIDDEIFKNPFSNQGKLVDAHNQLTGQIETMKRLAKIALSNEDYEHMRVILRAIANGEI